MRDDKAEGIMTDERERERHTGGSISRAIGTAMITEPSAGVFNAHGIMSYFHSTSQAPRTRDLTHSDSV